MRKNFGAKPYLYPQPVMIIGTYDENGNANAMNAAWGGMAGANKIIIDLSSHKTTDNIQLNRAFTVSVGDVKHLTACDYVGMVSAHNAPDKMEKAGFTTTKSDFVNMSRYEYGVLSLMARHPGQLFTKEQIFEAVWHQDSESCLTAVTNAIGRIRQKIEDDRAAPVYIRTISNLGYQFMPTVSAESVEKDS